ARARQLYTYAASYFADPDAQYQLARLYLDGVGGPKDARQAVRWVSNAANKGHHQAQALMGTVLFEGRDVPRRAALGLAWLTVAKDGIAKEGVGPDEAWITDAYASAFAQATDEERRLAYKYLEGLLGPRR